MRWQAEARAAAGFRPAVPKQSQARLAYADPPYPGQSRRHYADHPDYAGEVDHAELIERLEHFDGWALSTSMMALRGVLALCPVRVVVAVWHVTNADPPGFRSWSHHYCWEPVIVAPARPRPDVRNVLAWPMPAGELIVGQKPEAFSAWVFRLMGAEQHDEFSDLYPGSGEVGRAWDRFSTQLTLCDPNGAANSQHRPEAVNPVD